MLRGSAINLIFAEKQLVNMKRLAITKITCQHSTWFTKSLVDIFVVLNNLSLKHRLTCGAESDNVA